MSDPRGTLTIQLLDWLASRPRTYADTMDAWRSTCPRLTVWEDALLAAWSESSARMRPLAKRWSR